MSGMIQSMTFLNFHKDMYITNSHDFLNICDKKFAPKYSALPAQSNAILNSLEINFLTVFS